MSTEEIVKDYLSHVRRYKAGAIALMLVALAGIFWTVEHDLFLGYVLCIVTIVVASVVERRQITKQFQAVGTILTRDCDPEKYRAVLELLMTHMRLKTDRTAIEVELARCDVADGRFSDALERLQNVDMFNKRNPRWFVVYQLRAQAAHELGDTTTRDAAMEDMAHCQRRWRKGSANRRIVDEGIALHELLFRPAETWSEGDAARVRERLSQAAAAEDNLARMRWTLCLAEYELAHDNKDKAHDLLASVEHCRMTALMRTRYEQMRGILEG